ncbi:MAG: hypothetical protein IH888_00930 [Planctomycetes bacterium]|nr:hypothetical protein [Planctomycetota bacterium]
MGQSIVRASTHTLGLSLALEWDRQVANPCRCRGQLMLLALKHTLKLGDSHFHPHHLPVEYAQLLQRLDDALPLGVDGGDELRCGPSLELYRDELGCVVVPPSLGGRSRCS